MATTELEDVRQPRATILQPREFNSKEGEWIRTDRIFQHGNVDDLISDLPDQCYIFLDQKDYPKFNVQREKLFEHFDVPSFLANRTCSEINGYAGCSPTYAEIKGQGGEETEALTSCSTWFRHFVKMVQKVPKKPHERGPEYVRNGKGYIWFEMTFFTRWEYPNKCQVLCIDAPFDFPDELEKRLRNHIEPLNYGDPFSLHADLIDLMIVYSDISVWRVRDPIRELEKARWVPSVFQPIHEISRHAIHTSEVLEIAQGTLEDLSRFRAEVYQDLPKDIKPGKTYLQRANNYAQFQISLIRALKKRSDSTLERLKNEVTLGFNNIARSDNTVMKSIALLTMIFLPATFICALFSTTFFTFNEDNGEWQMSNKLWIYFAVTIPATAAILVVWYFWMGYSARIMQAQQAGKDWIEENRSRWGKEASRQGGGRSGHVDDEEKPKRRGRSWTIAGINSGF